MVRKMICKEPSLYCHVCHCHNTHDSNPFGFIGVFLYQVLPTFRESFQSIYTKKQIQCNLPIIKQMRWGLHTEAYAG